MSRYKAGIAVVGILCFTTLLCVLLRQPRQNEAEFELSDGGHVKVMGAACGKIVRIYNGKIWQRALFLLCGTNISTKWRGDEITIRSRNTNDVLFVHLNRIVNADFSHGPYMREQFPRTPISGSGSLVQVSPSGKVQTGKQRLVSIKYSSRRMIGDPNIAESEDIYWEFPPSNERELHFRLYLTKPVPSTNEFTIPNPAVK
jgi:hypothetical protein